MLEFLNSSGVLVSRDGYDLREVQNSLRAQLFRVFTNYICKIQWSVNEKMPPEAKCSEIWMLKAICNNFYTELKIMTFGMCLDTNEILETFSSWLGVGLNKLKIASIKPR